MPSRQPVPHLLPHVGERARTGCTRRLRRLRQAPRPAAPSRSPAAAPWRTGCACPWWRRWWSRACRCSRGPRPAWGLGEEGEEAVAARPTVCGRAWRKRRCGTAPAARRARAAQRDETLRRHAGRRRRPPPPGTRLALDGERLLDGGAQRLHHGCVPKVVHNVLQDVLVRLGAGQAGGSEGGGERGRGGGTLSAAAAGSGCTSGASPAAGRHRPSPAPAPPAPGARHPAPRKQSNTPPRAPHHKAEGAEDDQDGDVGPHVRDGGADALPRALLPRARHHLDLPRRRGRWERRLRE